MRRGDFATAWQISDAALASRDPATRDDPSRPYHERWVWDGRALDGQAVLVRCYHGLGDTLQFARFLPALAARAASVTVEVQSELLRLIAAQGWGMRTIPFDVAHPRAPGGVDVEIMELSHALRLAPDGTSYFRADTKSAAAGTGVCWQAGQWDAARSIPPELLAARLPRAISLQPGHAPFGWTNAIAASDDVFDTARLIAGLNRVVTVDTMVAHLAGALGVPTVVLLKADADWRWGTGATVPWYASVHPARQAVAGDWSGALSALVQAMQDRMPLAELERADARRGDV